VVTEVDAPRAEQKRRGKEVARAPPGEREQFLSAAEHELLLTSTSNCTD
jgi:hypothetical protein